MLFGLVYMVPLTVFTTYGIVTETSGGRLPLAYVVTLITMVFTALSYARMAAAIPVAGSAYTYTQRTFGAPAGFLAGWSLLLDYLFLPMLNYLVIGLYLNAALPALPAWAIVLASIAIVTVLNIIGIVSVARANFLIIAIQTIFIVVFVALAIAKTTGFTEPSICWRRSPVTAPPAVWARSWPARPSCVCRSSASTPSPRCPRRLATPDAQCRRRS